MLRYTDFIFKLVRHGKFITKLIYALFDMYEISMPYCKGFRL